MLASTSPEAYRGTFPVPHQTEGSASERGCKPARSYNGRLAGTDVEETAWTLSRVDIAVKKNGYSNLDVKRIWIDTEATSRGVEATEPAINPTVGLIGNGVF